MRDKVKYTTKVKLNSIDLTLKTNQMTNTTKLCYQINSCRFGFWKNVLTGIQFKFIIIERVIVYNKFKNFGNVI
jgi:hypothetical protein